MLRFELDVAAADMRERTIEGRLVPYGAIGRIQGAEYRFQPGSVRLARSRTPLLVDHDRSAPIGVLEELVEGEDAAYARFRVDSTPAGDTALVQAASGSRGALSVGAELEEATEGEDGVTDVVAARVVEASLLALGAFDGAEVTRVAAEMDEDDDEEPEPNPDQTELLVEEPTAPATPAESEDETMETGQGAPMVLAERTPAPRELRAGELVSYIIRAQHGDREAVRYLEAALTETISTDVTGLLPPSYERTVIGSKTVARPLYNAFRSRPLPGVGLLVSKPKWTTRPDGEWAADVNADAHSTKVVVGSQTADVIRWDWAGAIPYVVVQRSDPSIVDEIYGEAVQDFYLDVEAKVYGELGAAAAGVSTTLGAAIAEFHTATGGAEGGRSPELIIMAPDVWGEFADVGALSTPTGAGDVSGSSLSTSFAGIAAITSGMLPAGETILATRRAVDARVTEPVRLTANAIGALNVELAVVGEGMFDTDYPQELLRLAAITPARAAASSSSRSSRS